MDAMKASDNASYVPAYWLSARSEANGKKLPVIVGLRCLDAKGNPAPLPSVQEAIDRTVTATGHEGLVIANILEAERADELADHYVQRAFLTENTVLLLQCATPPIAEAVMNRISETYRLALVS